MVWGGTGSIRLNCDAILIWLDEASDFFDKENNPQQEKAGQRHTFVLSSLRREAGVW